MTDSQGQTADSTLTITVTAAFVARDDGNAQTPIAVYGTKAVMVLENDSGLSLAITSVTTPTSGVATIAQDAKSIVYTPNAGFVGTDRFDYTITDSYAQKSTATVYIVVKEVPVSPTQSSNTSTPSQPFKQERDDYYVVAQESAAQEPAKSSSDTPATTDKANGGAILLNNYDQYFDAGKELTLSDGQIIYFDIERIDGTDHHSVTIARVGHQYADIVIRSEPIAARIVVGEKQSYDVDKDGENDIEIALLSTEHGLATMSFKQLSRTSSSQHTFVWQWWWILIAIVVLYGLYRYSRSRSRKKTEV